MRYLLSLLLLLGSIAIVQAQDVAVSITPDGPLLRGKVATFTIHVSSEFKDVSDFEFYLGHKDLVSASPNERYYAFEFTNGTQNTKSFFVVPSNRSLLSRAFIFEDGIIKASIEIAYSDHSTDEPLATGTYFFHYGYYEKGTYYLNNAGKIAIHFDKHNNIPISGPGKLLEFYVYVPLDTPLSSTFDPDPPLISPILCKTYEGTSLNLKVENQSIIHDFRRFGDVNNDGHVSVMDVVFVFQGLLGLRTLSASEHWYADVHPVPNEGWFVAAGQTMGDGQIRIEDVQRLLQYVVGSWKGYWPDKL